VPIAADESLRTLQDAVKISQANAASSYVLKLIKQGGMYRARQLAHFCQAVGSPVHISGGTELSCGRAAMLHLFSTLPNGAGAVEVTEVMADDICHERLPFAPMVRVPEGAGLGVTVDFGLLERFTVESS
jgi:L-alanine-DL-glutamate epimerase-like enolase superfamily enzyme